MWRRIGACLPRTFAPARPDSPPPRDRPCLREGGDARHVRQTEEWVGGGCMPVAGGTDGSRTRDGVGGGGLERHPLLHGEGPGGEDAQRACIHHHTRPRQAGHRQSDPPSQVTRSDSSARASSSNSSREGRHACTLRRGCVSPTEAVQGSWYVVAGPTHWWHALLPAALWRCHVPPSVPCEVTE